MLRVARLDIQRREERQVALDTDMTAREKAVTEKMAGVKRREKAATLHENKLGDKKAELERTRVKIQKMCNGL
jgi:hypothetical protein